MFLVIACLPGCKVYKQDILFQLDDNFTKNDLAKPVDDAKGNYLIAANDCIALDVFTNDGERIIDPNNELARTNAQNMDRRTFDYLVQPDGAARLPIVGRVKLAGLTINQAEEALQQAYNSVYKDSYVKIDVSSRRAILLGGAGGQVIRLEYENMTIAEVLALYGGVQLGHKANNIRLIRGGLDNPEVFEIDLTTISGMRSSSMVVLPGDIVYVEPWRRPWLQTLRDLSPILSITSSIVAFVLVVQNLGS